MSTSQLDFKNELPPKTDLKLEGWRLIKFHDPFKIGKPFDTSFYIGRYETHWSKNEHLNEFKAVEFIYSANLRERIDFFVNQSLTKKPRFIIYVNTAILEEKQHWKQFCCEAAFLYIKYSRELKAIRDRDSTYVLREMVTANSFIVRATYPQTVIKYKNQNQIKQIPIDRIDWVLEGVEEYHLFFLKKREIITISKTDIIDAYLEFNDNYRHFFSLTLIKELRRICICIKGNVSSSRSAFPDLNLWAVHRETFYKNHHEFITSITL